MKKNWMRVNECVCACVRARACVCLCKSKPVKTDNSLHSNPVLYILAIFLEKIKNFKYELNFFLFHLYLSCALFWDMWYIIGFQVWYWITAISKNIHFRPSWAKNCQNTPWFWKSLINSFGYGHMMYPISYHKFLLKRNSDCDGEVM